LAEGRALQESDRMLAAAALSGGGLRSVLTFDAGPATIRSLAGRLHAMLEFTVPDVRTVWLSSTASESDLWSKVVVTSDGEGLMFERHPGVIAESGPGVTLLVIPDLSRADLPLLRAIVALAGSDVANLERDGLHVTWVPSLCWLAACPREAIGRVTPHVLDRFALRIASDSSLALWSEAELRLALGPQSSPAQSGTEISAEMGRALVEARSHHPVWTDAALEAVLGYFLEGTVNCRREATLARLAHELARIDDHPTIGVLDVNEAASLLGFLVSGPREARSGASKPL
jgi:magnesium chelatase subunit D